MEPNANLAALVDVDLDTLATALYVRTDDLVKGRPELAPWRPAIGLKPQVSDAELVALAVMCALLGLTASPAGCGMPEPICATCSRICRASRATTSDCGGSLSC